MREAYLGWPFDALGLLGQMLARIGGKDLPQRLSDLDHLVQLVNGLDWCMAWNQINYRSLMSHLDHLVHARTHARTTHAGARAHTHTHTKCKITL